MATGKAGRSPGWSALAVLILAALATVFLPGTAVAGTVSGVTFAVADRQGGATTTWTVNFTTSGSGALAGGVGQITLTGPLGTAFSGMAGDYLVNGTAATTVNASNNTVTITLPASVNVSAGGSVTVVANKTTNPGTGVQPNTAFTVATTADTAPVSPAVGVNFTGSVSGVTFSVTDRQGGAAGVTWTVQLITSAGGPLTGGTDTITLTGPPGTAFSSAAGDYTVNGTAATAVYAVSNTVTITLPASVNVSASSSVTVVAKNTANPATGPQPNTAFAVATSQDTPAAHPASGIAFTGYLSGVSFTIPNRQGGASPVTWTVQFTTSAGGALTGGVDTITLNAPAGTTFSSLASSYSVNGSAPDAVNVSGSSVTLTVPTSVNPGNGSTVTVVANNVTNPPAGVQPMTAFAAATSQDTPSVYPAAGFTFSGAVSGVSFGVPNRQGGATGVAWSVQFTTSAGGALAGGSDTITIVGPAGTAFSATAGDYTVNGTPATAVSAAGNAVTITLPATVNVPASSPVTVVAANTGNPPTGSPPNTAFTVATSQDTAATAAASGVRFTGAVSAVSFTPASRTSGANTTWSVQFITSAGGPLAGGTDTITLTGPAGTTFSGTASDYTINGTPAAAVSAAGNLATITLPGAVSVTAGATVTVVAGHTTNPATGAQPASAFAVSTSQDTPGVHPAGGLTFSGSVSSVSFSVPDRRGGATGVTWTVGFTTSAGGPLTGGADTITLAAPAGTVFSNVAGDYTVNGTAATTVSASGNSATITLPASVNVSAGGSVTVQAANTVNPATSAQPGSAFAVATSQDTPAAHPAAGLNFTGAVSGVSFAVANRQGGAASTWTVRFTTSAGGALAGGSDTISLTGPAGTVFSGAAADYTVNGSAAAGVSAAGNAVTITLPAAVSLGAGSTVTVVAARTVNPPTGAAAKTAFAVATSQDQPAVNPAAGLNFTGSVGGVSFAVTNRQGGAATTWTVQFTTSVGGSLTGGSDTITLTAPAGTVFSGAASGYTVNGRAATTVSASGNSVTITLPTAVSVGAGGTVTVVATNTANPPTGVQPSSAFAVATSQDTPAVHPSSGIIFTGTVNNITFAAANRRGGATGVTWTVAFTTSAGGSLAGGTDTITLTGPAGTSFSGTAADYVVNGSAAAGVSASGSTVTITLPAAVSVGPGSAVTVTAANTTNPPPGVAASAAFAVATSQDTPAAHPASGINFTGSVSGVTFTPGSLKAGARTAWTVQFTTSAGGPLINAVDTITLTGPVGTVFSGAAADYTVGGSPVAAVSAAGNSVTLTVPVAIGANSSVTVVCNNTLNPSAGSMPNTAFAVATSQDALAASPAGGLTFTSGASVSFSPASLQGGANTVWTVQFTTGATGGLVGGVDSITLVAPVGTTFSGNATDYTVGGMAVSAVSTGLNSVTITLPAGLSINAGTPVTVVARNTINPPVGTKPNTAFAVVTSKEPQAVSPAADLTFTGGLNVTSWSVDDRQGGAVTRWVVQFSSGSALTGGTDTITLTAPTGTIFPRAPGSFTVNGVAPVALVASGNSVNLTLPAAVSVAPGAAVTVVASGVTNPPAGTYAATSFTVRTSRDQPASPASGTTFLSPAGTPARVTVSGASSVPAGATVAYTATALGTDGTAIRVNFTWSASGGQMNGGSWTAPTRAGTYVITAAAGSVTGSLTVTVVAGPAARVSVSGPASLSAGDSATFTASVTDAYGNPVTGAAVTWSATGGSIDGSGRFRAGSSAGPGSVTATVQTPGGPVRGSAAVQITAAGGKDGSNPAGGQSSGIPGTSTTAGDAAVSPSNQPTPAWATVVNAPVVIEGTGTVTAYFNLPDGVTRNGSLLAHYYDASLKAWIAVPTAPTPFGMTARVPAGVPVTLMQAGVSQPPDSVNHWANPYILKLASLGVVGGMPDGTFHPDEPVDRYQVAKVVALATGLDVAQADLTALRGLSDADQIPDWAQPYVAAVLAQQVMVGTGTGFDGTATVTRAQMATLLGRLLPPAPAPTLNFTDAAAIPAWAADGVARVVAAGLVSGFEDGSFRPDDPLTRAQMAKIIAVLVDRRAAGH